MSRVDIPFAVIGGGAVGRAIAFMLSQRGDEVVVVDSGHPDRVENQSTRNSGVIHTGIYYAKETKPYKARLCVTGNAMLYEFCQEYDVPYARTGKLVVATNEREGEYLDALFEIASINQVPNLALIDRKRVLQLEPNVHATRALYVPSSGVIDAAAYLKTLRNVGQAHELRMTQVIAIKKCSAGFEVRTICGGQQSTFVARVIFNAAGLASDEIAGMINKENPYKIMAVRGESAKFYTSRRRDVAMVGMNVYPVPCGFYRSDSPNAGQKTSTPVTGQRADVSYAEFRRMVAEGQVTETTGVHLTPTLNEDGEISSTVTIGPAITVGLGKENMHSQLRPPQYYLDRVKEFFPGLCLEDIELHQCGIQARLANHSDWILAPDIAEPRFINLIGIDSPGLTASLAIAKEVVSLVA